MHTAYITSMGSRGLVPPSKLIRFVYLTSYTKYAIFNNNIRNSVSALSFIFLISLFILFAEIHPASPYDNQFSLYVFSLAV